MREAAATRLCLSFTVLSLAAAVGAPAAGATTVKAHADDVFQLNVTMQGVQTSEGNERYYTSIYSCQYRYQGTDNSRERFRLGGGDGGPGVQMRYIVKSNGKAIMTDSSVFEAYRAWRWGFYEKKRISGGDGCDATEDFNSECKRAGPFRGSVITEPDVLVRGKQVLRHRLGALTIEGRLRLDPYLTCVGDNEGTSTGVGSRPVLTGASVPDFRRRIFALHGAHDSTTMSAVRDFGEAGDSAESLAAFPDEYGDWISNRHETVEWRMHVELIHACRSDDNSCTYHRFADNQE